MNRELINAINIQAKREGYFLPVLRAIVFEQFRQIFPAKQLLDILDKHRGGNWGVNQCAGLLPAPSLRSPDIRHGSIDISQAEIRYYTPTELKKHRLVDGDILVIKSNGSLDLVGKSQLYSAIDGAPPVTASNFVLILSPDRSQVNPAYLDCFLKTPQALVWRVDKQRTTTGLRNLDTDGYLATRMPLPPEQETQKEIVDILDSINNGLLRANSYFDIRLAEKAKQVSDSFEKLEAEACHQQSLLDKLKQSILQEAIQGKLTVDWRAANPDVEPASELLHRIQAEKARLIAAKKIRKEKPLPTINPDEIPFEIPNGWEWIRLKELGRWCGGGTPAKDVNHFWGDEIPWITPKDMKQPFLHDSQLKLTRAGVDQSSAKLIPAKSILFVVRGMILAHTFPVSVNLVEATINQDMKALMPFLPGLDIFLRLLLESSSPRIVRMVTKSTHGTRKLETEIYERFPLPLPPLAEQAVIVQRVEELMSTCRALEAEIEHARNHSAQLLQAVLKEAFAPAVV